MSIFSEDNLQEICLNVRETFLNEKNHDRRASFFIAKKLPKSNFYYKKISQEFCLSFVEILNKKNIKNNNDKDDSENNEQRKLNLMLSSDVDVIPNEYEGGFKIWEGLFDLMNFLQNSNFLLTDILQSKYQSSTTEQKFKEITICDLGCGSGLLSIYIVQQLKNYDCNVKFKIYLQDYNDDVIKLLTIPNVLINELEDSLMINKSSTSCQSNEEFIKQLKNKIFEHYCFMYGDWKEIKQLIVKEKIKFDLIITSETIYQEKNYSKLFEIFNECLHWPNGTVLIASKSHYFGIGGGTYSFLDFLDEIAQQQQQKQQSIKRNKSEIDNQITKNNDKFDHHLEGIIVDEIQGNLLRHIIQLKWFNDKNIDETK